MFVLLGGFNCKSKNFRTFQIFIRYSSTTIYDSTKKLVDRKLQLIFYRFFWLVKARMMKVKEKIVCLGESNAKFKTVALSNCL